MIFADSLVENGISEKETVEIVKEPEEKTKNGDLYVVAVGTYDENDQIYTINQIKT